MMEILRAVSPVLLALVVAMAVAWILDLTVGGRAAWFGLPIYVLVYLLTASKITIRRR